MPKGVQLMYLFGHGIQLSLVHHGLLLPVLNLVDCVSHTDLEVASVILHVAEFITYVHRFFQALGHIVFRGYGFGVRGN